MHDRRRSLMVRENQRIRQDNILPPANSKDNNLRDILRSQRLDALIHLLRLIDITAEPHNTELRLDLPGIDLDDADARRNQLAAQRVGEGAHGRLGRAVDAAALVGLAAGDGADVYNVAAAAVGARLEDGQDGLGHCDEAGDIGREHGVDVFGEDVGGLRDAFDEAAGGVR
jgi:hypothetical protein